MTLDKSRDDYQFPPGHERQLLPRYRPPPSEGPIVSRARFTESNDPVFLVGVPADVVVVVGPERLGYDRKDGKASQATPSATLSDRYAMRYDAVTSDASPCASVEVALWDPATTRQ